MGRLKGNWPAQLRDTRGVVVSGYSGASRPGENLGLPLLHTARCECECAPLAVDTFYETNRRTRQLLGLQPPTTGSPDSFTQPFSHDISYPGEYYRRADYAGGGFETFDLATYTRTSSGSLTGAASYSGRITDADLIAVIPLTPRVGVGALGFTSTGGTRTIHSSGAGQGSYTADSTVVETRNSHDIEYLTLTTGRYRHRVNFPRPWEAVGTKLRLCWRERKVNHTGSRSIRQVTTYYQFASSTFVNDPEQIVEAATITYSEEMNEVVTPAAGATFVFGQWHDITADDLVLGDTISVAGPARAKDFLRAGDIGFGTPGAYFQFAQRGHIARKTGFRPYVQPSGGGRQDLYTVETASNALPPYAPPPGQSYTGSRRITFVGQPPEGASVQTTFSPNVPGGGFVSFDDEISSAPFASGLSSAFGDGPCNQVDLSAAIVEATRIVFPTGLQFDLSAPDPISRLMTLVNNRLAGALAEPAGGVPYVGSFESLYTDAICLRWLPGHEMFYWGLRGQMRITVESLRPFRGEHRFWQRPTKPGYDPSDPGRWIVTENGSLGVTWDEYTLNLDSGTWSTAGRACEIEWTGLHPAGANNGANDEFAPIRSDLYAYPLPDGNRLVRLGNHRITTAEIACMNIGPQAEVIAPGG